MKVSVYDAEKKKKISKELKSVLLEKEEKSGLVHEVVRSILAAKRSGTSSTLTRSEVKGGGRKPWRQKGTGRARAGTIRSPLWKGGGITFGPKPRSYSFSIPKKAKRISLKSAISYKARNNQLVILDKLKFDKPKTKEAKTILDSMKIEGKITLIVTREEINLEKSFRNLSGIEVVFADSL
ncbi:MAG: 50S ribosomal protein L4, partial [Actinomycetia bacterium]|nr:50S ribosomal protein L4 [Actinomycetes bacterium]